MKIKPSTHELTDHKGIPIDRTAGMIVGRYTERYNRKTELQKRQSAAIAAQRVLSRSIMEILRARDSASDEAKEGLPALLEQTTQKSIETGHADRDASLALDQEKAALWSAHEHYQTNQGAYQQAAIEDLPPGMVMNFERTHKQQLDAIREAQLQDTTQPEQ